MLNYEILLARGGILVISGSTGYKNEYEKKKKNLIHLEDRMIGSIRSII
jgi:hypothetical protein